MLIPFLLVPAHDSVKDPSYWYEYMLMMNVGMWPNWAASVVLQCVFWGNFKELKTWSSWLFLWMFVASLFSTLICVYYLIWTQYYGYYSPMPFTGYTAGLISGSTGYLALWFRYYAGSWI